MKKPLTPYILKCSSSTIFSPSIDRRPHDKAQKDMVPVFKELITYLTAVTEYSKCFKEYEQHGKKQSKN